MVPESRFEDGSAALAHYDGSARARWLPEASKSRGRTAFERDRARVLHSSALRRLAGKTQVVGPGEGDFPRTRLTHSLECAQVGRELGKTLGCDPDLVEAACLAHDLGHPPFGHNGEHALDTVARDCGGFEGNAQSLRILTRLESKAFDQGGRSAGLNLTRAALDAATKYPWPAFPEATWRQREQSEQGKQEQQGRHGPFGVYAEDMEVFRWIRQFVPDGRSCLEAQVMDWADDVAYSVHDLEDGVYAGHIELEHLRDPRERREVCELAATRYADATPDEVEEAFSRLLALPYWPCHYDGGPRALAALKDLTSQLIGRFCAAAEAGTRQAYGDGPLHRYAAALVVPRAQRLECAALKGVTACYVMSREGASDMRAHERSVLTELASALWRGAPTALDPVLRPAFTAAADDPARLRVIVDQIAALTDSSAVAWYRQLAR